MYMNKKRFMNFPYKIMQQYGHTTEEKTVNINTPVKCIYCGNVFSISPHNTYCFDGYIDETPFVECPECKRVTCILYYIDNVYTPPIKVNHENKRKTYVGTLTSNGAHYCNENNSKWYSTI